MKTDGPILIYLDNDPNNAIWSCMNGVIRCKHLTVNAGHYFYCAAQPVEGQRYPFEGAGKQISDPRPSLVGCPYRPYSL